MGKATPENKERNLALVEDYKLYLKDKVPMYELVAKYKISDSAIRVIAKRYLGEEARKIK